MQVSLLKKFFKEFSMIRLLLLLVLVFFASAQADEFECKDGKVCRHTETKLPLLGLPRPFSTLYADNAGEKVLSSNVRAFQPLFVFSRQDLDFSNPAEAKGWYQVGPSIDDPMGWMKAQDLIEWKQSLIVAYTHPGIADDRRNPVLMFNDKDSLKTIVTEQAGSEKIKKLYETLNADPKNLPENIVSAEPNAFLDIDENFYLLPVLSFELIEDFDLESRLLQLAAALPEATAAKTDSPNTLEALQTTLLQRDAEALPLQAENLGIDVKFVFDITGSMQPFVDATKKAISEVATTLNNDYPFMRFGLIGYKDELYPFNNGELTEAAAFLKAINTIRAEGGDDFQEEMFAGVKAAIDGTWNDNSLKIIVIVGDASSHLPDSPKSLTKMDEKTLRDYANTYGITILSIHLKSDDPRVLAIDFPVAEQQFSTLARNEGLGDKASYVSLPFKETTRMSTFLKEWMEIFGNKALAVRGGSKTASIAWSDPAKTAAAPMPKTAVSAEAAIAKAAIEAALVRYLGKSTTPPRDITVWVYDHDLADPSRQALDVRILLNRAELNDLILALENILKAFKRSQLTEMEFFESIQSVVASSSKKQDVNFKNAKDLKDSGLLPSWINTLPYRSQILKLNNEIFAAMSPDERAAMEQGIENRLRLYREYNENNDIWQALNEKSSKNAEVFALSLEMLP
jgi:hypothetical protein